MKQYILSLPLFFAFALLLGRSCPAEEIWLPFEPKPDPFSAAELDLRFLNETFAGEHGYIGAKDGHFIHLENGKEVRFWAVNGPPLQLASEELRSCARMLAKRGVNMVRIHTAFFDKKGQPTLEKVARALEVVETMKKEGIYSLFSIYFPLWMTPEDVPWLEGYDGKNHPFAALFFNAEFQEQYRNWWTALLRTPNPRTGKMLVDEPAVCGVEMQNEDSLFFWTFSEQNLPEPQLRILERMFGDWVTERHGSIEAALAHWNGLTLKRDALDQGRLGFRPLWSMFNEKTPRDQDTARFLFQVQTRFYEETYSFLRKLGFKGPITASNWTTASPEIFGPLEKLSYTTGDFVDRHGYFSCSHKGENAAWSIRAGHTFADRSALRFDPEVPGKPKVFAHPIMEVQYDDKPSMISETTWNRPNRFRSEAPLFYAVYGALQGTDAIVHFALDGAQWRVKPNFWMQPWTLMSPAMMGQFPAAALIYRRGMVRTGDTVAEAKLNREDLLQLKGTPLPQDAALDELRLKDVPTGTDIKPGQRLDPLLHFVGQTQVRFTDEPSSARQTQAVRFIDRDAKKITSTTGELELDYGKGLLWINAPQAQGVSGLLKSVGMLKTADLVFTSRMELGHIVAVSLDEQPISTSGRILVQVMSEEQTSEFTTEAADGETRRITSIGQDPWQFRSMEGSIRLTRSDARDLRVFALDHNGYRTELVGSAENLMLRAGTLYYLVTR